MISKGLLVIATPQGQLGNTLVHFAHIRAFALQHKVPVIHCAFERYANLFEGSNKDLFCQYSPEPENFYSHPLFLNVFGVFKTFLAIIQKQRELMPESTMQWILGTRPEILGTVVSEEMRHMLFLFGCAFVEWVSQGMFKQVPVDLIQVGDEKNTILSEDSKITAALQNNRIVLLDGWCFREPEAFHKQADHNRAYFKPTAQYSDAIDSKVRSLKARSDVLVGVHVRWGDYKEFMDGIYYFPIETYVRRMKEAAEIFSGKRVSFLVCSNENIEKQVFNGLDVEFGPGSAVEDMYTLAKCDYVIGPPSTFTSWASFYGGVKYSQIDSSDKPLNLLS